MTQAADKHSYVNPDLGVAGLAELLDRPGVFDLLARLVPIPAPVTEVSLELGDATIKIVKL
ncbi:MAG TPA: hypothetical protein VLL25_14825 [Acidimicrobiales bacterium]|nr:hypothetical protein [Acidimicrobiales bacterium]